MYFWVLVLFSCVAGALGNNKQCGCPCFNVKTAHIELKDMADTVYYSQAASVDSSEANDIDSVCTVTKKTKIPDNLLWKLNNLFVNGTNLPRAGIQTSGAEKGSFVTVGPSRMYNDFILGSPCPGTLVIYSCIQTGDCVTSRDKAEIIINSKNRRESKECINKGIQIAQKSFPNLKYFMLPNKLHNPCVY